MLNTITRQHTFCWEHADEGASGSDELAWEPAGGSGRASSENASSRAELCRLCLPSCRGCCSPAGTWHRLFVLFLAKHPPQIGAPLPCSFPTLNLSYPSCSHLPSFPLLSQSSLRPLPGTSQIALLGVNIALTAPRGSAAAARCPVLSPPGPLPGFVP